MTTIRVKKDKRYSTIYNPPFENSKLSWEARGLLAYLLTKPDDWTIMLGDLVKQGDAKLFKVRRMLKELEAWGHVERMRVNAGGGKFRWETTINERPNKKPTIYQPPTDGSSIDGSTIGGKPHDIVITEIPITESPITEGRNAPNGAPPQTLTPQQRMLETLSSITGMDYHIKGNAARLGKTASELLAAHYTPDDALKFAKWWQTEDWRGKKGDAPKLSHILEGIGQVRNGSVRTLSNEPTEAELEATRAAIRKAKAQAPVPDEELF